METHPDVMLVLVLVLMLMLMLLPTTAARRDEREGTVETRERREEKPSAVGVLRMVGEWASGRVGEWVSGES